jgi:hypothetical protein
MKKNIIKQKQRQKQSVTVNVNLAKARARSSRAKKSRGKKGSVMMLPPPIYASPINNLIPAMYGAQGQQIQPKSTEELLKSFLSKAEPAPEKPWSTLNSTPASSVKNSLKSPIVSSLASFKSLGSSDPISSYMSSSSDTPDWVSEISTPSILSSKKSISTPSTRSGNVSSYSLGLSDSTFSDDSLEDAEYNKDRQEYFEKYGKHLPSGLPSPFQNEERTYLKASEPDNESTAPKFSDKGPESFYETLDRLEAKTKSDINNLWEPRRPDKREPVRIPFEDESSVSSLGSYQSPPRMVRVVSSESQQSDPLNPFPNKIYNKMMGYF